MVTMFECKLILEESGAATLPTRKGTPASFNTTPLKSPLNVVLRVCLVHLSTPPSMQISHKDSLPFNTPWVLGLARDIELCTS